MSYAGLIAAALRLIKAKGVACTWYTTTPAVSPTQPWKEISSSQTGYSTHIVLLPFDSVTRRMFGYDGDRPIPVGSLVGYVPGSSTFSPSLRDTILVGSTTYTIAAFDALNPNADQDIVYIVELHR